MFAARPAVARQLFAQMFARAVKPHSNIIFGQAKRSCDGGGIIAVQINTLEQITILLRHGGQQSFETLAEHTLIGSSWSRLKFTFQLFERSLACVIPAVKVNDGATQNPIEPRHCIFIVRRLLGRSQRLDEAFLHHVFSMVWVAQALARKPYERVQVFQHGFFHVLHL